MNYSIKKPGNNNNIVALWSSRRLPFEPKGWLYDMREALKNAINQLIVPKDSILTATYTSPIEESCDVDNILVYNVGPRVFKTTCLNGFLLERNFSAVPCLPEQPDFYSHYQQYALAPLNQQPLHWAAKNLLASWDNIVIPGSTFNAKPHVFWQLLKENPVSIFTGDIYENYFGIELKLSAPHSKRSNLAAIIKPMLDGIISAFHFYQGEQLDQVSKRLALMLSSNPKYISGLLLDRSLSLLGGRRLLWPFQKNVQWNPADDKCVVIKLICTYFEDNVPMRLSGKLFSVTSK